MTTDSDLLFLLEEADNILKENQVYVGVQYTQSPSTIYCSCGREYHGLMTHVLGMDNLYDNSKIKWCPECIKDHAVEWWSHCFRMEQVESVQIMNTKEEVRCTTTLVSLAGFVLVMFFVLCSL